MTKTASLLFLLGLFIISAPQAFALTEQTQEDDALSIGLIAQGRPIEDGAKRLAGIDISLHDGWHTYWRSPGAVGQKPILKWERSQNVKDIRLEYPKPTRKTVFGIDAIGYEHHVVFPLDITPNDAAQEIKLDMTVDLMVCKEMCLPKSYDLSLTIPPQAQIADKGDERLQEALALLPAQKNSAALSLIKHEVTDNQVRLTIASDREITSADVFIETDKDALFGKPFLTHGETQGQVILTAALEEPLRGGATLSALPLKVTITTDFAALERELGGTVPAEAASTKPSEQPLLWIVLLSLLGGFILNLMPCVLPVLSLKVLSFVKNSGKEKKKIRRSFLASASGIVVSFLLLGGIMVGLKSVGVAIGWGIQFQQPLFLMFMIVLLTLFATNLLGFFEINLPQPLMDKIGLGAHHKLAGDFSTGMLATLLATPCSAPFLGTAIGFAFASGAQEIMIVFGALGLGMAIPYLLIASYPKAASALPKPGAWMIILKRLLGAGMAATAIWLLLVMEAQTGTQVMMAIGLAMAAFVTQLFFHHLGFMRFLTKPVIALVLAFSFFAAYVTTTPPSIAQSSGVWQTFNEDKMKAYVTEGKTVFVDITADWCITCKVNKRFVISSGRVKAALFDKEDIIAMQGDWTNTDPALADYMKRYERFGIPFNIVFGPGAPDGILLPELLSEDIVIDALNKASGP